MISRFIVFLRLLGAAPSDHTATCTNFKKENVGLEVHPRKGRERVPNREDELDCGDENTTSQEKVRVEQGGKSHRGNTN
jgi:hypothetical protein